MLSSAAFAMAGSASLARSTISASLSRSSISSGLCHIRGARSVPARRRTSREQEACSMQRKCVPFPPPSSFRPCSSSSSHWCRPNHPGASRRSPSWASARRRPPLRDTFKNEGQRTGSTSLLPPLQENRSIETLQNFELVDVLTVLTKLESVCRAGPRPRVELESSEPQLRPQLLRETSWRPVPAVAAAGGSAAHLLKLQQSTAGRNSAAAGIATGLGVEARAADRERPGRQGGAVCLPCVTTRWGATPAQSLTV